MFRGNQDQIDEPLSSCFICSDFSSISNYFYDTYKDSTVFRVIHQNIRSYRKNFDEFLIVLQGSKVKFNCIVMTEAWLNDGSDIPCITGYNSFQSTYNLNNNDGVIVYLDNTLSATCDQLCLGGVATALSLTFAWAGLPCRLVATYRSPSSCLPTFINAINEYYNNCNQRDSFSLFVGDINCDILNVAQNSEQERYLDVLHELGFLSCVDKITRPESNTCIDHIFAKSPQSTTTKALVLDSSVTDHRAVLLEVTRTKKTTQRTLNDNDKTIKYNWESINNALSIQDWNHVLQLNTINEAVVEFTRTIKYNIDMNTSTSHFISGRNKKIKPWISSGLIKSIRYRDKLSKRCRIQPFDLNLRNRFIRYRNTLNSLIKRAKYNYYKNKVNNSANDPKKLWKVINEVAGREAGMGRFPVEAFCGDGDTVSRDKVKDICNSFNQYYASVGERLASAINHGGLAEVDDADHAVDTVFELRPVTQVELNKVVLSINGESAPGYDCIPSKLIKNNIGVLSEPLTHLVNLSVQSGEFPNACKIAKVVPIYKSGIKSSMNNFRPISLLSTISKIIEKCVKLQLSNYLNVFNIITNQQYGFRTDKNTSDALFDITKHVVTEISSKKYSLITFLDLAKAFDSVDRSKLICKLKFLGVRNNALRWFESYLSDRQQIVTLNGIESNLNNVDYGVIQGSTLGPLLFLVYINNITKLNIGGNLFLFADDTAVVSSGCTWDEVYRQASEDLAKIKTWFDCNTLTVNIEKTKYLPFFTRSSNNPGPRILKLHTCGESWRNDCGCGSVERVEQYKYLGIIIDHKLSWVPHVQYIKQRLRKLTYGFTQLGQVLSAAHLRTVYFAHVQSLLQYGVLAWGGASSTVIEPLAVSQRSIIKIMLKRNRRYPTHLLVNEFPVLNIRQLFIKEMLIYIKKNKNKLFNFNETNYITRNRLYYNFQTPRINLNLELSNSYYIAHFIYRNLPREILQLELDSSVAVYKREIGEWLLRSGPAVAEALVTPPYRH